MTVADSIAGVRQAVAEARAAGRSVGLVPTMGALHEGHGRLIEEARRGSGFVVVSVFVNPIQFNRQDDYARYPRPLANDVRFCEQIGADVVFAPSEKEMYPRPLETFVEAPRLAEHLCGAFRPGHFRGVATVVAKLFNIVQPDRAYFGEKDAQQLALIRRMARDLDMPVEIVPVATVRQPDGLALSSRNQLLSAEERCRATALYRALSAARAAIAAGETDVAAVKRRALPVLEGVRVEYFEVVDAEVMQPVERVAGPVRVVVAAWVGSVRLIDNVAAAQQVSRQAG